jgi:predicted SnoaL-like aldol condensation-catalyzing enzyme
MNTTLLRRITITLAITAVLSMIGSLGVAAAAPAIEDDPGSPAKLSNVAVAFRLIDAVFNDENAVSAETLVSENAVIHTAVGDFSGPHGLLEYIASVKHTYPGAVFDVVRVTQSDNGVTIDWILSGYLVRIGASEDLTSVTVELRGQTVISLDGAQVAGITFDPAQVVRAASGAVALDGRHGQPY